MFTSFVSDLTEQAQALAALRQSEALKSAILDTALDGIVSIDHEGMVQEWNRAAQNIFGYRRDEALGRSLDDLVIPPAMREVYHDGLTHYLLTGVGSLLGRPIELVLRRADGTEFLAGLATAASLQRTATVPALIRDITAQNRSRAWKARSACHLIEGVIHAIYMLDPEAASPRGMQAQN
jgi:PAS domain S-box-containing protein